MIQVKKITINYIETLPDNARIEAKLDEVLKQIKKMKQVDNNCDDDTLAYGEVDDKYTPYRIKHSG